MAALSTRLTLEVAHALATAVSHEWTLRGQLDTERAAVAAAVKEMTHLKTEIHRLRVEVSAHLDLHQQLQKEITDKANTIQQLTDNLAAARYALAQAQDPRRHTEDAYHKATEVKKALEEEGRESLD